MIAFTGQRYKIWKQITTTTAKLLVINQLLLLVKDTKFESKSQRSASSLTGQPDCFYWSKIQNLKANHNCALVYKQSNRIAFTGQRYKIWKQITTLCSRHRSLLWLLLLVKDTKFESKSQLGGNVLPIPIDCFYWSKIQNLKANHNCTWQSCQLWLIAFTGQRYKIWKQITTRLSRG